MPTITDDFTGSEGQALTARPNWVARGPGANRHQINASNALKGVTGGDEGAVGVNVGSSAMYVQCVAGSAFSNATAGNFPLAVRITNRSDFLSARHDSGTGLWEIWRNGGNRLANVAGTVTAGDVVRLEVDAAHNLTLKKNGTTVLTSIDSDSKTATFAGIRLVGVVDPALDSFEAGELAGPDTTAPTLTSPTGTGGSLVGSGSVSTNEANGSLYAVATASATAPTAAQVKLGQDHTGAAALRAVGPQTVTATGVQNIASGAISAGTRYWHYMHEDAAANQSAVVSSASFVVTAPALSITSDPLRNQADTLLASTLIAKVAAVKLSDMTVTATWTNQTTNGSGQLVVSDAALTAVPHLLLTSSSDGAAAGAKVYTPA